jgi:hypothetical protein
MSAEENKAIVRRTFDDAHQLDKEKPARAATGKCSRGHARAVARHQPRRSLREHA